MICGILRGKRCDLRSRMSARFVLLLAFALLMILTQHTTKYKVLSRLHPRQPSQESKIFRGCRHFTSDERINATPLYYYEDLRKNKSLIWCKVPKAGSTTLARMFLRLAGARIGESSRETHNLLRKYYPKLSPRVMSRRLHTTFKFLVVRHPFERILSAYRDKLENFSRDPNYIKIGTSMVKEPVENGTGVEPYFYEFVTYLLETSPETYDEHWMPISRLCFPCDIHYDAIVKIENFDMEIKVPLRQAGIYEDVGRTHSTGTNRSTVETYFQELSFTEVRKLYEIYRKDFLLFGYTPDEYFAIVANETKMENNSVASA